MKVLVVVDINRNVVFRYYFLYTNLFQTSFSPHCSGSATLRQRYIRLIPIETINTFAPLCDLSCVVINYIHTRILTITSKNRNRGDS